MQGLAGGDGLEETTALAKMLIDQIRRHPRDLRALGVCSALGFGLHHPGDGIGEEANRKHHQNQQQQRERRCGHKQVHRR